MNLIKSILLLLFLIVSHAHADQFNLTFKVEGNTIKELDRNELKEYEKPRDVTIYEPHEHKKITYIGFDFDNILKRIYGNKLNTGMDLLIKCRDGYQPVIPFIKFSEYKSYLVYSIRDRDYFTIINIDHNNETVNLGPYYLIWDNLDNEELLKQGSYDFPYQIIEFDLIKFKTRFPKMSPPENSSEDVKKGFLAFRKYCSTCHTINGEGGEKSVELNYPVSVTEFHSKGWIRSWIKNPASIRYNSRMPAFSVSGDKKDETIENIISYLEVMKDYKKLP